MEPKEKVLRLKELDKKIKAGKATKEEISEAKELAHSLLKKGGRGPKQKGSTPHHISSEAKGTNDFPWYDKYPELTKDAANVIFNEIAGTKFRVQFNSSVPDNGLQWPLVGVRFEVVPTIGKSLDPNDAYNYQMRDLWLKLHRAFRGVGTYEYADLGIAIFCILHAFADIARAERIYGIFNRFSAQNRSYPKAVLQALDLEPTLVDSEELADYRYQLNRIIAKARVLCLPKGMTAFAQIISLVGNVFKDSDNSRAQWYVYDTPFTIRYNASRFTTGGCADYVKRTKYNANRQRLSDIVTDLNTQIDILLNDTDITRMCSDILKAFGENGVQVLECVPEDFVVEPLNDETRKLQLHNTIFAGAVAGGKFPSSFASQLPNPNPGLSNADYLMVYQMDGYMRQCLCTVNPIVSSAQAVTTFSVAVAADGLTYCMPSTSVMKEENAITGAIVLDTWKDSPSQEDIVEMTRQSIVFDILPGSTSATYPKVYELDSYSTYVVTAFSYFVGEDIPTDHYKRSGYGNNILLTGSISNLGRLLSGMSQVDWHPMFLVGDNSGGVPTTFDVYYDIDNYSLISSQALARLHETCTLSLFKLDLQPESKANI